LYSILQRIKSIVITVCGRSSYSFIPIRIPKSHCKSTVFFLTWKVSGEKVLIGSLSSDDDDDDDDDDDGNENAALKQKSWLFDLLCDYSNLFNLYNVTELFKNWSGKNSNQLEEEKEKTTVMCSHFPQNFEFDHCTSLFCGGRQRNVTNCINARAEFLFTN